ncbi:LARGE xylosyl- and glucuronyltransferase 2-like [Acanthaster planci]|uniref:LARGE xylosyl- and glucuronyltransferase 2-like n=1 Tax=Acanthaster planci TaxID=133434 RepID=A0A8B7XXF0_ACAPL|nr:LARGE xylosyl- and glucuronyltransferase 2-like [Acanthaster planci]
MAVCVLLKRKINRCIHRLCLFNIAFFVWIFVIFSLLSLMVTYISFILYLDDNERVGDRELDLDFPVADGVDDVLLLQEGILRGEEFHGRPFNNLISSHIIDSSTVELAGWWMPQVRWNPEIDCSLPDQPGTCGKVLSVKCKPDSIRAVYQFLPINPEKSIDGIYFHAKSAASKLTKDKQVAVDATYSAIALLRYKDGTSDRIRLDFPAGTHPYIATEMDKLFPADKVLQSVTVMLCCHGYQGSVKFMDVTVRPISDDHSQVMVTKDYVQKCPDYFRSVKTSSELDFDVEQFLTDGKKGDKESQPVTLVTQVSLDRIDLLESTLEHWQGPVSVALYVPTKASKSENDDHGWKRQYIKKKLRNSHLPGRCNMVVVYAKTSEDEYPVNYLRNLAIRQAKTKYIFLLDADFVPSPDFQATFLSSLAMVERTPQFNKTAFVVPVFEYTQEFIKDFPIDQPKTKQELKDKMFGDGAIIFPFMISTAPEAHRPTDYRSWYSATLPYKVTTYQDKYEPYLILRNAETLPTFDERFMGYGMNKATYAMELYASGYEYVVLPNMWAIHVPHRESSAKVQFLLDPLYRLSNRADRFEFVSDLMRRHGLGGCKADRE